VKLKIKKLIPDLDLRYHSDGASGIDIVSPVHIDLQRLDLHDVIPCGFSVEIPIGYEGQIRPRSSCLIKGFRVEFGTIDSDYRGEIKVVIIRHGIRGFHIEKGERIAQLVICPVQRCDIEFVDELSETKRGIGGFGSTGK